MGSDPMLCEIGGLSPAGYAVSAIVGPDPAGIAWPASVGDNSACCSCWIEDAILGVRS